MCKLFNDKNHIDKYIIFQCQKVYTNNIDIDIYAFQKQAASHALMKVNNIVTSFCSHLNSQFNMLAPTISIQQSSSKIYIFKKLSVRLCKFL